MIRVTLVSVEARFADADLANLHVRATANAHDLGAEWTPPPGTPPSAHPQFVSPAMSAAADLPGAFRLDLDVTDRGPIRMQVWVGDGTHTENVAFEAPLPDATSVVRHEGQTLTVTVTLLDLGSASRETIAVSRSTGGTSSTHAPRARHGARVELVHPIDGSYECPLEGQIAQIARMGLWDEAWDHTGTTFRNGPEEEDHFIGRDPRRLYVRVFDPDAHGPSVSINLRTLARGREGQPGNVLDANGGAASDAHGPASITCMAVAGHRGLFASRALMLVSSRDDLTVTGGVHTGGIPNGGMRLVGQPDFRLRRASMFGFVEARYAAAPEPAVAELFRGERHLVELRLYAVDPGTGDPFPANMPPVWDDFIVAREVYSRIGIWLWSGAAREVPEARRERDPDTTMDAQIARVSEPWRGDDQLRAYQRRVVAAHAGHGLPLRVVRAFYMPALPEYGQSFPSSYMSNHIEPEALGNTSWINAPTRHPYTLAHEMLHVLLDLSRYPSPGHPLTEEQACHYGQEQYDFPHNLLKSGGTSRERRWDASSRIRAEHAAAILDRLR